MSSPYVILGNRPLDQWKVTELKEELRRRRLTIKGLKEDLIKRLDEAVRLELESAKEIADNSLNDVDQSELPSDQAMMKPAVYGKAEDLMDVGIDFIEKVNEIDVSRGSLGESKVMEAALVQETNTVGLDREQFTQFSAVEVSETVVSVTTLSGSQLNIDGTKEEGVSIAVHNNDGLNLPVEDVKPELSGTNTQLLQIKESSLSRVPPIGPSLQGSESQTEGMDSTVQLDNVDSKCLQSDSTVQPLSNQVHEVDPNLGFQVMSDSVSTESVSIIEKNELKVDVITDNVNLELDINHEMVHPSLSSVVPDGGESHPMDVEEPHDKKVPKEAIGSSYAENADSLKNSDGGDVITDNVNLELDINHEMVHPSLSSVIPDGGKSHPMDVEEPHDKKTSTEEIDSCNAENVDSHKNSDSGDSSPPEKLSLDRSSGDDSMEEDILESKQMEYKSDSNETRNRVEQPEVPIVEEVNCVDVVGDDEPVETQVANSENVTVSMRTSVKRKFYDKEEVGINDPAKRPHRWNVEGHKGSTTPKDSSHPAFKRFSRSDSTVNEEVPKERIVPASSKPPTNSLRIDQFLRPFTLKAVQELLGKTGTATNFWMDHIKTHCYVSFSSVEEAVRTRNAVYNLQWPPNGGRLLVAEFVDPQEVKTRVDASLASPATPSSAAPTFSAAQSQPTLQHQPSPRLQVQRQQLPLPSLPPPPMPNPPLVTERLHQAREVLPRERPLPTRDHLNLPPPPTFPENIDPPIVTLDDLFRKTKATPRIYYLPLSDEQVALKLQAQRNNVHQ